MFTVGNIVNASEAFFENGAFNLHERIKTDRVVNSTFKIDQAVILWRPLS